jgi:hypothetical protein
VEKGEQAQVEPGRKPTKCSINESGDKPPFSLLIEAKLPPGKTIKTASHSELLIAVRAAVKQWPIVAPQIVRMAVHGSPQWASQIFQAVPVSAGGKRRVISPERPP